MYLRPENTTERNTALLRSHGHPGGWPRDSAQEALAKKRWIGLIDYPAEVKRGELSVEEWIERDALNPQVVN